jgi:ssDNA-binding Zn-finger/Zn-ribbon topoisomerase 1
MLEGECPKCGKQFYGLALANPRFQMCDTCGSGLDIKNGDNIIRGYSPFGAENISIRADSKKSPRENNVD